MKSNQVEIIEGSNHWLGVPSVAQLIFYIGPLSFVEGIDKVTNKPVKQFIGLGQYISLLESETKNE